MSPRRVAHLERDAPPAPPAAGASTVNATRIGSPGRNTCARAPIRVEQLELQDLERRPLAGPQRPPAPVLGARAAGGRRAAPPAAAPSKATRPPSSTTTRSHDALDRARVVRDEHERRARLDLLGDARQALALERLVADREHLVDQQHVGVEVRGDREAEPHEHAARVRLDRHVDEVAELGELDDALDPLLDLLAREAVQRAVELDVLAAGEVAARSPAPSSSSETTRPPHSARPESSGTIPARQRSVEDLPAPLRPTMPDRLAGLDRAATRRRAPARGGGPSRRRVTNSSFSVRAAVGAERERARRVLEHDLAGRGSAHTTTASSRSSARNSEQPEPPARPAATPTT